MDSSSQTHNAPTILSFETCVDWPCALALLPRPAFTQVEPKQHLVGVLSHIAVLLRCPLWVDAQMSP
jgi:hypothetical protein